MSLRNVHKPNFIIIGSAKCGTTTLAKILADHPDCCFSRPKEVCFFCSDEITSRGWEWYKKHFSHYTGESVVGEATPAYTDAILHPNTAKRIFEFKPDIKLIYIVRNPYERFVSAWRMHYRANKFNARYGINAYFQNSPQREADIKSCCYDFQLNEYVNYFSVEQIHVVFLEDLAKDALKEMTGICEFLDIDPQKLSIRNKSGENRGDTYKYTDKWWKKINKLPIVAIFKKFLPISLRRKLFEQLFVREVPTPREELSTENMQAFWEIVNDDAKAFLDKYGKPSDFWDLKVSNKVSTSAK